MGILSDRGRRFQQWRSFEPEREHVNRDNKSTSGIRRWSTNWLGHLSIRQLGLQQSRNVHNNDSRRSLSIYPELSRTRYDQPDPDPESDPDKKCDRHNKYVYPVIPRGFGNARRIYRTTAAAILGSFTFLPSGTALAEGVGGVSATANPIANSSGSVTNQAIQVLQGPYITNTYGGGVQCQGSTFNVTPYVQFADSRKDPWEDFYNEPQYNTTDKTGSTIQQSVTVKNYPWETWYDTRTYQDANGNDVRWFEDGADITIIQDVPTGDGVPDAIQDGKLEPTWYKPVRTDMRANQSFNLGLSATLSIPLNRGMQRLCKEAATANVNMQNQLIANKRLDFEIARLKNCGELKKAGIFFHPQSPYASVCADVIVTNPGGKITPHTHEIPQPTFEDSSSEIPSSSESQASSEPSPSSHDSSQTVSEEVPSSPEIHSSSSQLQSNGKGFFRGLRLPWSSPVSQQVSPPSAASQLGVWQVGHSMQPQMLSPQSSSQSED